MRRVGWMVSVVLLAACGRDVSDNAPRRMLGLIPSSRPAVTPSMDEKRQLFQLAKNHIRAGEYLLAVAKLEQLRAIDPTFGGGTVEQYLERANKEVGVDGRLRMAERVLAENPMAAARLVREVAPSDTMQTERLAQLEDRLDAAVKNMVEHGYALMKRSKDRAAMEEMRDTAAKVGVIAPNNMDAPVLAAFAKQALKELPQAY